MSGINNFVGYNLQSDVLDPRTARSIINYILSFENSISQIYLPDLLTSLQSHSQNIDFVSGYPDSNPHNVSIKQLNSSLIQYLYSLYTPLSTSPLSLADFTTLLNNPITMFELMRRLTLNQLSYEDGYGPVPAPVYDTNDLTHTSYPPYPIYFASEILRDNTLTIQNTPSYTNTSSYPARSIPVEISNITIGMDEVVQTYAGFILSDMINQRSIIAEIVNMGSFYEIAMSTMDNTTTINNVAITMTPSSSQSLLVSASNPIVLKAALPKVIFTISDDIVTIYFYSDNSTISKARVELSVSLSSNIFNQMYLVPGIYDRSTSTEGIKNIVIYPTTFTDEQVYSLFGTI